MNGVTQSLRLGICVAAVIPVLAKIAIELDHALAGRKE
jgi:hypothetical protein